MSKKILIPGDLIDPNQTTVIEIPNDVQKMATVFVKSFHESENHNVPYGENAYYPYEIEDDKTEMIMMPNEQDLSDDYFEEEIVEEDDDYTDSDFEYVCLTPPRPKKNISIFTPITSYFYDIYDKRAANRSENEIDVTSKELPSTEKNIVYNDIQSLLDTMDKEEYDKLHKNLIDFQLARRKLLFETTKLNSMEDISATLQSFI